MGGGGARGKPRRKHGKERLDRYYHLAKEQGYRARSAFKLIQLAQRFPLFQLPGVPGGALSPEAAIVDLCAAPGGWLQVCVKHAPVATRILGIDLVPIRSIRGVETLTEDITHPSLPAKIKKLLQGAHVWLVLHDGSPNMGTDWSIDAFNQNVLVLSALRTAALLLCEGGTFVSKVFRSQDYAALLFVLQTLFTRVHATKPLASRNVSAEIFVVCQGYKKPAVLDHRLFDPKSVFLSEGLDAESSHPTAEKAEVGTATAEERGQQQQHVTRLREGELRGHSGRKDDAADGASVAVKPAEGDYVSSLDGGCLFGKGKKGLFAELVRQQARRHRNGEQLDEQRRVTVQEFFDTDEPASLLVLHAREVFFQEPPTPLEEVVQAHMLTTAEVLRCLRDVQVLGKSELVAVLKWRFRVKKALLLQQRRAALGELRNELLQQGTQPTAQEQQVKEEGGSESLKGAKHGGALEDASTEDRSRSEADSHEVDDVEGELRRLGALVQRREEKRKKRVELKEKQKELRLRLSRGSCLDAGESVGHHVDPDLFTLSSKTAALFEEASASVPAEDDLFQSDDEKSRKRQGGEVGAWIGDDTNEGSGAEESDEGETLSEADSELDPVDCMEAQLTLRHRLQKLQQAQARAGTKDKKQTRRQKVRSEWATELQNFRECMQAEAAAVLAQKAKQGAESDESEDEEEEEERVGSSEGDGRTDRKRCVENSTGRSFREVLDDDDDDSGIPSCALEDASGTQEARTVSGKMTRNSGKAVEGGITSRGRRGILTAEGGDGGPLEIERTARWFRQPIFDGCEDDVLPAAGEGLEESATGLHGSELVGKMSVSQLTLPTNLVRQAKKRRRPQGVGDSEPSDEAEAAGNLTATSVEVEAERGGVNTAAARPVGEREIAELDEDALPRIPVCKKKQQQQRRREQARKEQEKTSRRRKMKDTDDINDHTLHGSRPSVGSKGERLEEVPALPFIGSTTAKPPSDPEELARIQTVGSLLINKTLRMDLIDGAYNRYAFNDEQLPEWFVEEEKKHNTPQLPLTKDLVRQYRQKLLDISRRPIRKVREAKARKQLRERRQLQKVKSEAVAIAESAEFTEAGKARAIEKIFRKAGRVKEKLLKNYYVVSRGVRGGGTLISKKSTGTKAARTKFVDRRMKKDKRAQKNARNRRGRRGLQKPGKNRQRKSRDKAGVSGGRAKN